MTTRQYAERLAELEPERYCFVNLPEQGEDQWVLTDTHFVGPVAGSFGQGVSEWETAGWTLNELDARNIRDISADGEGETLLEAAMAAHIHALERKKEKE